MFKKSYLAAFILFSTQNTHGYYTSVPGIVGFFGEMAYELGKDAVTDTAASIKKTVSSAQRKVGDAAFNFAIGTLPRGINAGVSGIVAGIEGTAAAAKAVKNTATNAYELASNAITTTASKAYDSLSDFFQNNVSNALSYSQALQLSMPWFRAQTSPIKPILSAKPVNVQSFSQAPTLSSAEQLLSTSLASIDQLYFDNINQSKMAANKKQFLHNVSHNDLALTRTLLQRTVTAAAYDKSKNSINNLITESANAEKTLMSVIKKPENQELIKQALTILGTIVKIGAMILLV